MEYRLIPDILGALILAATFVLCLRSFRRDDRRRGEMQCNTVIEQPLFDSRVDQPQCDPRVVPPSYDSHASQKSLAELLNLMDENTGGSVFGHDRRSAATAARPSFPARLPDLDGIEVTVRVDRQRSYGIAAPVGSPDIINAVWEPVDQDIRRAGRLSPSKNSLR